MSEVKVNKISPRTNCGTVQLGDSGDTITIPSGATITNNGTQTGFGRTGTVDWQTASIKTSTFTAANGEGYFADTSSGAFTMNLPAGTAGNIVSVVDYTNSFQTHNLTVSPNGSQKIGGIAASFIANTEGQSLTWVYVDDTEGWKNTMDSTSNATGNPFIDASGGTETTSGNCKIHTFTGPGTFTVNAIAVCAANNIVSHLIVGAGGGGGEAVGGGGGAGGFREVKSPVTPYTASPLDGYPSSPNRITVTAASFPITVGAGGAGSPGAPVGGAGGVSTFSTITSAGGGGGARCGTGSGSNGGSGGGGGIFSPHCGGSGNTPSVSPPQGNNGGVGYRPGPGAGEGGGGGGGATAVGGNAETTPNPNNGGDGGAGATTSITASSVGYAGGGGGAGFSGIGGSGGSGGGGCSGPGSPDRGAGGAGTAGTTNTGGGGGAGNYPGPSNAGGNGGSGIVVIRYKFQ